jgi:hypothetical protein
MRRATPAKGLLGAAGGAVGILPLLPIASGLAIRFAAPPTLPGALRNAGDIKEATWAEAAVLLVAVPVAALVFGRLLPRALTRIAPRGNLSFEWAGAAFAASFFLAQRGLQPGSALLAGLALAALTAVGVAAFRRSFAVRRIFARRNRAALLSLALAGACIGLARRAGSGARLLLPDLATELLLCAALLPAIAAAAGRILFRDPGRALRRLGAAAPLAILLSALILLRIPTPGLSWIVALASLPAAAWLRHAGRAPRAALCAALLLFVFTAAWRVRRGPLAHVEMFEDGHSLAFAQVYLQGARPYAETSPVHGWGSEGGVDGFAFRLFGPTLHVYRVRTALWGAASPFLLAGASVAAFGCGIWGALGFLFSMSFSPLLIERQALAFASLLFLYLSFRSRSRFPLIAAGVLAGWELLYSLDYGLIVLFGASAGLFLLPSLEARLRRFRVAWRPLTVFLASAMLGASPFLALLAVRGALDDFLRVSFLELPRWVTPAWGLPAGSVWKAAWPIRDLVGLLAPLAGFGLPFAFVLALLSAAGAALLIRASKSDLEPEDRAAWIGFCVAAFAMRGVLGRADEPHLWNYSLFAGVPAVWMLRRAWRSSPRGALSVLVALLLLLRLHPVRRVEESVQAVVAAGSPGARSGGEEPPRAGGERIPAGQAKELTALREALDARLRPGETFFDFANQPALYFFADRAPPVRFHTVAQYESAQAQREVVDVLAQRKPPVAVFTDTFYSSLDVSNSERAPEVARYLADHYEADTTIGPWRLARLRRRGGPD